MNPKKRKRLEAAGWRFGNATDFLGMPTLSIVEARNNLADAINRVTYRGRARCLCPARQARCRAGIVTPPTAISGGLLA